MTFPVTSKLDETLSVEVHQHQFFLGDRDRTCWTYMTRGLSNHQQREMALSLLVEDGANPEAFPKTPIKMFQLLGERTAGGRVVECGDSTRLGQRGIFGFPGLFYVPAIQYEGLPNLDEYMALILVHETEYGYVRQYGLTRFLSHLGRFCSSFPYPTWNTQARPSLFTESIRELSMLADASHISLDHSFVHRAGDVVQIQLHKSDSESALHAIESRGDDEIAILNTAFSPRCDASLYWQEGQARPGAYAAPDSKTNMIGGSFLSLEHAEAAEYSIVEDGYAVSLTAEQWQKLTQSIRDGQSFECDLKGESRFVLDFVDIDARPRARHYQSVAVWHETEAPEIVALEEEAPIDAPPAPESHLIMGEFVNQSGAASLAQRVSYDALMDYFSRIHHVLAGVLVNEADSFQFEIDLKIYPHSVVARIVASIELNPAFIRFITEAVEEIETCKVSSQVSVRLPFFINMEND